MTLVTVVFLRMLQPCPSSLVPGVRRISSCSLSGSELDTTYVPSRFNTTCYFENLSDISRQPCLVVTRNEGGPFQAPDTFLYQYSRALTPASGLVLFFRRKPSYYRDYCSCHVSNIGHCRHNGTSSGMDSAPALPLAHWPVGRLCHFFYLWRASPGA